MRHITSTALATAPRSGAPVGRFVSFDDAPIILTFDEVARLLRLPPTTMRRDLQRGTFLPAPFAKRPYRWRKSDVEAHVATLGKDAAALARDAQQRAARREATRETAAPRRRTRKPRPQ